MYSNLTFNSVPVPEWLFIKGITNSLLPSTQVAKNKKTKLNERHIKIDFIIDNNIKSIDLLLDELKMWMIGNDFGDSKLVLPTDDRFHYIARFNNTTDMGVLKRVLEGYVEFVCYYPNRIENVENIIDIKTNNIEYVGNTDAYPIIQFEVTSQCDELKLSFSNSKYNNYIRIKNSFNKGNVIKVDMKTKKVTVNDTVNMKIFTLDSKFHKLTKGINTYTLNAGNANVNVIYYNEYL